MSEQRPKENINEQRYRALIDNAPEVVFILDVESEKFIDANQAAIDLFDFSREELLQLGPVDISPNLYQGVSADEIAKEYIQQAIDGGNPFFDWVHIDRSGREIPCEIRLVRFPPYDRLIIRASIIDLTEQKSIEAKLYESEERLQLALRATGLGCFDWYPQDNLLHWDKGMHEIFGVDPADPIDRNEHFLQCVHPDDREEAVNNFQIYLDPNNALRSFINEYRIIREEKVVYLVSHGEIIRAANGEVQRVIGTVQDVTERIRASKQIKHQTTLLNKTLEQLQFAIKTAELGIWQHELATDTLDANDRLLEIYGVDPASENLSRESWREQIHPDDKEAVQQDLERLFAGEKLMKSIFRAVLPSGEVRHIQAAANPIFDQEGNLTELIGINIDITNIKKNAEALQEREAFHRAIYDNSLNGVLVVNDDGKLRSFNQAACRILGFPEEELATLSLTDLPITNVGDKNRWLQAIRQKDKEIGELVIAPPDQPVCITQYNLVHVKKDFNLWVLVDITERKAIEEALRDREERFRTVFNQQFQFMAILTPEGRFLEVNDLSLRVVGVTQEDVLGSFFWEALAWARLPEWQGIIKDLIKKAGQTRETLLTELAFFTLHGEERWADTSFTAILNEADELQYILVQASDITERKKAEENLLQTQQELSELANRFKISTRAAQLGIWDWQIPKDQLIWDETMMEIYGLSPNKLPDRIEEWKHYLLKEDRAIFQEMIDWTSSGEKELNSEFRIQRPDGAIRHIKAVASVQRDEKGNAIGIIGANWDITQEKEAEQERIRARQLELRNRELEQFAYVASHDLKEPLRTVISFVGLLKRGYQDRLDERANEYIKFVVEASSRMSQLIKGLLDYSRIGADRELSQVDSADLVQQILNDLSAQISNAEAVIEVAPLPQILGYATELRMLFQNLISNAIKFRKENQRPQIRIAVKEEKKTWVFSVLDEGIGIAPMYQEQIFALFQRLHGREEYEGTGIGLAHCQKIADLHGGVIWVESEVNQGSTFYFSIAKSEKDLD